jgi:Asp-tRNA(Asn)/Glu-tRNA(Gln) amidotransferase A subunit family amidase
MDQTDLCFTPAVELVDMIKKHEISPVELVEAVLARIGQVDQKVNALATVCGEDALETARGLESDIMSGKSVGPICGIPFTVKDVLWTKGVRTTFGSYIWENFVPDEDTPAVRRLRESGAILLGKNNTPEYAMNVFTENPLFGVTRNPWNLKRTPGGSSGGAGAALAAGLGPVAVGTDGGGSCRIPAACCAVVGFKATMGRVPHPQNGDIFGSHSHVGPMARTVADVALMLECMTDPEFESPYLYGLKNETFQTFVAENAAEALKGRKIAWSLTFENTEVDEEVVKLFEEAVKVFESFGCVLEEARPELNNPAEQNAVFIATNTAARLEPYLKEFGDKMHPMLLNVIERGLAFSAVDMQRAKFARSELFENVQRFFKKYDLLITPTLTTPALPVKHNPLEPITINGKEIPGPIGSSWFPCTSTFNMTGNPAISIPCGWTPDNMPVGLHIVGPWLGEDMILRAAAAFERAKPWADKRPPV